MTRQRHHPGPPAPMRTIRWRWYHFYFLIALFNLFVIGATLFLYHGMIQSYELALDKMSNILDTHRWVMNLRLVVLDLNAPGNDVFESRQPAIERTRYEQAEVKLGLLMRRESDYEVDLSEFRGQFAAMAENEKRIFAIFEALETNPASTGNDRDLFEQATVLMAKMDRHQTQAVTSLSQLEQELLMREASLLEDYGAQLGLSAALEKILVILVVPILIGMFWYGRTLQRMNERMIADQQQAMSERNERLAAVGEVCSAVAHGIRNPLASISSSAQLMINYGTLDDETRRRVTDVLTECQRLDRRITRLLNFSSVPTPATERYDVQHVIVQAIDEVRAKLDERGIHVERVFDHDPLVVQGNRDRMVQCIIEILANAMEHLPDEGRIEMRCRRSPNQAHRAEIDIIDNGTGIPDEARAHVFDLFFTSKGQGIGIGLASVRRTIEFYGGRVSAEPTEAQGAHIRITLPLTD